MSASPYFKKASTYTPPKSTMSSQSTFYTQSQSRHTPQPSEMKNLGMSAPASSYYTRESKIRDVHQKYEKEAQSVNNKYVQHYQQQLEFGNSYLEAQDSLHNEKRRNSALEVKLDDCFREMDQHKRQKLELAREAAELREELRKKDGLLADRELKLTNVQHNATSVNYENEGFRLEMKRLSDTYNLKMKEVEEKYKAQIKDFTEELDMLRSQIKDQDIDTEAKIRGVSRDFEAKIRNLENQIREKDRIMNESAFELRSLKEYNMKVKMEFEEELRRQVIIVKDQERVNFEAPTKDLENRVKELEVEKDTIEKKIPELMQEIKNKDKMLKEFKLKSDEQLRGLKRQQIDLEDKISELNSEIEKLSGEVSSKDVTIVKLHKEINHLNLEAGHIKEQYIPEIDRLHAKNDDDIRRFQEYERQLKARIMELERMLKASEIETGKLKADVERMKQSIVGNIHQTISEVFVDYGTQNLQGKSVY